MQGETSPSEHAKRIHLKPVFFAFVLGIVLTVAAWYIFVPRPGKASSDWFSRNTPRMMFTDVVSGEVSLAAQKDQDWTITVAPQSMHLPHVIGTFRTAGGPEQDIQVVLAEAGEFDKWKQSHPAETLYRSDHITSGSFDVRLPEEGTYVLSFRNPSTADRREVAAEIKLRYLAPPAK